MSASWLHYNIETGTKMRHCLTEDVVSHICQVFCHNIPWKNYKSKKTIGLYLFCTSGQYFFLPTLFAKLLKLCQSAWGPWTNSGPDTCPPLDSCPYWTLLSLDFKFGVVILLENWTSSKLQLCSTWQMFFWDNLTLYLVNPSRICCKEASPSPAYPLVGYPGISCMHLSSQPQTLVAPSNLLQASHRHLLPKIYSSTIFSPFSAIVFIISVIFSIFYILLNDVHSDLIECSFLSYLFSGTVTPLLDTDLHWTCYSTSKTY